MVSFAQFIVLFAGPIGLLLLAAFVIVRWVAVSRRRRVREAPQLEVVPGTGMQDPRTQTRDTPAAERPALHVVAPGGKERQGSRR